MLNTKIPLYGICILLAIIIGFIIVYKNIKKLGLSKEETQGLLIYFCIGIILGAKYFTFLTNIKKYKGIFDFFKTGLSSYGAVIGVLIMFLIFSIQFKKNFKELISVFVPALPLMYGIGKIGCFLAGCCYGIEYNGPFSIVYKYSSIAPLNIHLFPVQLLEAIIFILIFIYIAIISKKEKYKDFLISITFILCGLMKFLLDYLRISHINKIITTNQIVSIAFILVGIFLILIRKKLPNR